MPYERRGALYEQHSVLSDLQTRRNMTLQKFRYLDHLLPFYVEKEQSFLFIERSQMDNSNQSKTANQASTSVETTPLSWGNSSLISPPASFGLFSETHPCIAL